jgi:hypothetical protein
MQRYAIGLQMGIDYPPKLNGNMWREEAFTTAIIIDIAVAMKQLI